VIIVVGLDNTLCQSRWRSSLIETEGWEAYHEKLVADEPNRIMKQLVASLKAGDHIVVACTSRPDRWRMATYGWLMRKEIVVDELLMRADNDFRPASQVKIDLVDKAVGMSKLDLVIDDRDDVLAAFRAKEICCLQFAR